MHADGTIPGLRLTEPQLRVLRNIVACRTEALGGHLQQCDSCGHERPAYNSCRNRHCPKCLGSQRAQWLEDRQAELLPVPYFHAVFTMPHELSKLTLQNKKELYGILFRATSETLSTIASDEKHLGARIGFIAVLHTWGQTLQAHPHVHCVIPGGGLSPDGTRWISAREKYLLPVAVLRKLFRGKFLAYLRKAYADGALRLDGSLHALADPAAFAALCNRLQAKHWVVYLKEPFGGPEQVLKYLARYTHRVAISNRRLASFDDQGVTFRYKDYSRGCTRTMTLEPREFIRRFLLHVLPKGFQRIRHYGLLANRSRRDNITRCRQLLATQGPAHAQPAGATGREAKLDDHGLLTCPKCAVGTLRTVRELSPVPDALTLERWARIADSPTPPSLPP